MASAGANRLLQCCCCEKNLDVDSHTLACLHNVCQACMGENTLKEEGVSFELVGKCPKCGEAFTVGKSKLLPFLSTDIKRQSEQRCAICTERGVTTIGNHWCHTCDKLFCKDCNFYHIQLLKNHICQNLQGIDHMGWISFVMSDQCFVHDKDRGLFCQECNMCFCETCYNESHPRSGCAGSRIFSVKDEVMRWKDEEGHILQREVRQFEKSVKRSSADLLRRRDEFTANCQFEMGQIWQRFEEKVEIARLEAIELCETLIQEQREEEKRTRHSLDTNDQILPKIEVCLSHCKRLLDEEGEPDRGTDVLLGLTRLRTMVRSWQEERNRAEITVQRLDLTIDYSNLLIDFPCDIPSPLSPRVRIFKEMPQIKELFLHREWTIRPGLNTRRIRSIHVAKEDEHVFFADWGNESIIELSERGEMLSELRFDDENRLCFSPFDVCSISPDILVVCGEGGWRGGGKLVFLERNIIHPFLRLQKSIKTKKPFFCLCSKNELIYGCDFLFKIHSFTKEGRRMKTIKVDGLTTGSMGSCWSIWSRIRVDPLTGNFRGSRYDCPEIVSFNSEGEILDTVKKVGKEFFDFSFDKYGHLYFPTKEGIFSFSPEKKNVYKFPKIAELDFPVISVLEDKIIVWIKNEGKDFIKIFKIFY